MTKKITKREVINAMLAVEAISANEDFKAYLENELALLDRKAGKKKATKTQVENEGFKEEILNVLDVEGATVTEIQARSEVLSGLTNQRVSALLRQMVNDGKVIKTIEGKKSLFAKAE